MENTDLDMRMKGLKIAQEKNNNSAIGTEQAIAFRGAITLFSTGVLAASATTLVKVAPQIQNIVMNEGIAKSAMAVLGVGASLVLIPVCVKLISYETSFIKAHLKNRETIKRYSTQLNEAIAETEKEVHSKQMTKTL